MSQGPWNRFRHKIQAQLWSLPCTFRRQLHGHPTAPGEFAAFALEPASEFLALWESTRRLKAKNASDCQLKLHHTTSR